MILFYENLCICSWDIDVKSILIVSVSIVVSSYKNSPITPKCSTMIGQFLQLQSLATTFMQLYGIDLVCNEMLMTRKSYVNLIESIKQR